MSRHRAPETWSTKIWKAVWIGVGLFAAVLVYGLVICLAMAIAGVML